MTDLKLGSLSFGPSLFKDIDKFFIGYDDQFNKLSKFHDEITKNVPNYPFYNIKKTKDNTYVIEMALAGFAKTDVEVTVLDDKLVVKGLVRDDAEGEPQDFIFKGISNRAFTRMFALSDQVEVQTAEMVNGMLKIFLERVVPEHKKPKKIEINDEPSTVTEFAQHNKPQLLTEASVEKVQ
jgi:molecular chaperone IbpA